jgi:hypothetical protein
MNKLHPYIAAVAAVLVTLAAWCGLDRIMPTGSNKQAPTNTGSQQFENLGRVALPVFVVAAVLCVGAFGLSVVAAKYGTLAAVGLALALNCLPVTFGSMRQFGITLTTPQLLLDVIGAFRKSFPFLNLMGTDFRGTPLKLNQQYMAHVRTLPSASTYDPTTGYANGATSGRSLLTDVPVTVDTQPTCPLKWLHLDEIKDVKENYDGAMSDIGYVLSKGFVDATLGKANHRYFTKEVVAAIADCDYDWLQAITEAANNQGMTGRGRVLLVSSAVATVLATDARMISKDYAGQLLDDNGYRQWKNVGGFALIQEYPDLPTNNGTALTGVAAEADDDLITKAAHGLETGDPFVINVMTGGTGLLTATRYWAIKASASTFKAASSYANAIAGTAIDITVDGTTMTVTKTENLRAMAFDRRALCMLAGVPAGFSSEIASAMGIPLSMIMESTIDPESKMPMGVAKWQQQGTGDLYFCPTFVYGTHAGKQGDATTSILAAAKTAGSGLDYAGIRCTSGAT